MKALILDDLKKKHVIKVMTKYVLNTDLKIRFINLIFYFLLKQFNNAFHLKIIYTYKYN